MDESGEKQTSESEVPAKIDKTDVRYEVKMNGRVFGYFANRLSPIYNQELEQVRRDGSLKGIEQFHKTGLGNLMTRVLDKFEGSAEIPKSVLINLSQKDLDLILDKVEPSTSFGGWQIHAEMVKDLKANFKSGKLNK